MTCDWRHLQLSPAEERHFKRLHLSDWSPPGLVSFEQIPTRSSLLSAAPLLGPELRDLVPGLLCPPETVRGGFDSPRSAAGERPSSTNAAPGCSRPVRRQVAQHLMGLCLLLGGHGQGRNGEDWAANEAQTVTHASILLHRALAFFDDGVGSNAIGVVVTVLLLALKARGVYKDRLLVRIV